MRGGAFFARPLAPPPPTAAAFAPEGRENEYCVHDLEYMPTQIIQVGVFRVVTHFLPGSFAAAICPSNFRCVFLLGKPLRSAVLRRSFHETKIHGH